MLLLEIVNNIVASGLLVLTLLFVVEVWSAVWYRRPAVVDPALDDPVLPGPRTVVLIPAHDEASIIAQTLQCLRPELDAQTRVLVVADNCADGTAEVARQYDAQVVERNDPATAGKGYAIDWGIRALTNQPPEVVVVLDADSRFTPGGLRHIARLAQARQRPVQAYSCMETQAGSSSTQARISAFAWTVRNKVRPLGLHVLGLPCQLQGNGFAVPWDIFRKIRLATGNIVEDMQYGLQFAQAGYPPLYCPEVSALSSFPLTAAARTAQRRRWEHGHLALILALFPWLLREALARHDRLLLLLAVDLCIPPLALLVALLLAECLLAGVLCWLGQSPLPFFAAGSALGMLTVAIVAAWVRYGRQIVSLQDLAAIPGYLSGKISLYLDFALRRQRGWVRTHRDS